jgi:hypothetical protein
VEVAAHGEINGVEVPCLLIAAKDDFEPDSLCKQNAHRVWSYFVDGVTMEFMSSFFIVLIIYFENERWLQF